MLLLRLGLRSSLVLFYTHTFSSDSPFFESSSRGDARVRFRLLLARVRRSGKVTKNSLDPEEASVRAPQTVRLFSTSKRGIVRPLLEKERDAALPPLVVAWLVADARRAVVTFDFGRLRMARERIKCRVRRTPRRLSPRNDKPRRAAQKDLKGEENAFGRRSTHRFVYVRAVQRDVVIDGTTAHRCQKYKSDDQPMIHRPPDTHCGLLRACSGAKSEGSSRAQPGGALFHEEIG